MLNDMSIGALRAPDEPQSVIRLGLLRWVKNVACPVACPDLVP